jgi:small GTP-binding protein
MINKKEQFKQIKDEVISYTKEYNQNIEKFKEHVEDKLQNYKPTLMIYGVYNAGKSTLLNAIFGKDEMAQTADRPMTDRVDAYEYNGFTIYDTPGINAPIQHENITLEHLNKVEMVLFVISNSGSFEDKVVYEKLIEVVKHKKPLLIVLNDKDGAGKDSSDIDNQINKVNENLNKIAQEHNIDDISSVVNIVYVDAKIALEGKIKNQNIIIIESNINEVEDQILSMLKNAKSTEIENALKIFIENFINETLEIIDEKIDNQGLQKLQKLQTNFEKLKQRSEVELRNFAYESVQVVTRRFFEAMLAREGSNIESIVSKSIDEITKNIRQRLDKIIDEIKQDIKEFDIELKNSNISVDIQPVNLSSTSSIETNDTQKSNSNTEVVATLGAATTLLPPVVPIGGIPVPVRTIAQVAITLYGLFNGSDEAQAKAEARLEEKKALHLSAKNRADELGANLKAEVVKMVENDLIVIFDTLFKNITTLSQQIDKENNQLLKDKQKLIEILDKL